MTLSRKKRARKEAERRMRKANEAAMLLAPEYQNRRFPDGTPMLPEEAMTEFPPLVVQKTLFVDPIEQGCDVLVAYAGFTFWLCNVELSVVPDEYRGAIVDYLPSNDQGLGSEQSISFERRHVIRRRRLIDAREPSRELATAHRDAKSLSPRQQSRLT